jgi:GalNAc-alpha-(1->4)-GalNAc-alpha-(1->3)-diNAcBac-PP-undecaprenol alpha-1,4-N-acetyl-D-galactosaminyltransferase
LEGYREMKKIKVMFVMNDFIVGGVQRQFSRQIKYYDKNKFDICLVTLFYFKDKGNLYGDLPEDLELYKLNFGSFTDIRSWFALARVVRKVSPEIVVSSLFFSNTVMRILKLIFGYKIISREHNTYTNKTRSQVFLDRLLSHVSCRIVAVSSTVADFTSKQEGISPKKFVVIHNGIDLDEIKKIKEANTLDPDGIKKRLGIDNSKKLIVYIGRLTAQKNHESLIRGFGFFSAKHNDYLLVFVGEGSAENGLKELASSLSLSEKVLFVGVRDNVSDYYMAADVFASASFIEGLSNSYLEALAFGLPLVATKTAGTDEILEDGKNGYFIEGYSGEAVCAALEKMASSDIVKMKSDAEASMAKYDIKETVKKYEDLMLSCLGQE